MSTDGTGTATLSDQVIEEILGLMGRRRINKAEMARRLGTKEDWVGRRLNGRQRIDVVDLQKFASVLGVTVTDLFPKDAGATTERYLPGERVLATIGALDDARIKRPPVPRRPARRRPPAGAGSIRPATPVPV